MCSNYVKGHLKNDISFEEYQKKRMSDKLKIEKELFPQCIQARNIYHNKRKSSPVLRNSLSTFLPGENIRINSMSSSIKNVTEWLDKNEKVLSTSKRKPFSNLNTNFPNFAQSLQKPNVSVQENKTESRLKRSFSNNILDNVNQHSDCPKKKAKLYSNASEVSLTRKVKAKSDRDESGIEIDIDNVEIIEDSQDTQIDKDKLAWLAVIEADNRSDNKNIPKNEYTYVPSTKETPPKILVTSKKANKVPFLKKSNLFNNRSKILPLHVKTDNTILNKPIVISLESKDLSVTINITSGNNFKINFGQDESETVPSNYKNIQTNLQRKELQITPVITNNFKRNEKNIMNVNNIIKNESEELFTEEVLVKNIWKDNSIRGIDSGSDDETMYETITVKADVHSEMNSQ